MSTSDTVAGQKVAVTGLGFVGLPLAATLADVGFQVTGVDVSEKVLKSLRSGKSHFKEEGLQSLLDRVLGKRLIIDDHLKKNEHDIYIITVGTPVDSTTYCPMMQYVESASEAVGKVLKKGDLVILRSTVPVGATRDTSRPILEEQSGLKAGKDFGLVFAPERLIAGKALKELRELPQIVGGIDAQSTERARQLFKKLTEAVIDVESLEAAEMAKIIDNTYRDLRFGYANQMALLCEKVGVNMYKLANAVNFGYARNQVPAPSPGVGGACLTKDPYILANVGEKYGYEPKLTKMAREVNEHMPIYVAHKALKMLEGAGKNSKEAVVCVLGFAFKGNPETSDIRDSATISLVKELIQHGCTVIGNDPAVPEEDIKSLGAEPVSIEQGFKKADAVIIMTNHTDYASLNVAELLETMKKPGVFIDGWHLFEPSEIKQVKGIHYGGVGND